MLLAIDIGNTQTVVGLYAGKTLQHMWRIATNKTLTADEIRIKVLALLSAEGIAAEDVQGAVLASVVPQLTNWWIVAVRHLFGLDTMVVTAESTEGLFVADYPAPREIGADRVADTVAAVALYGAPVIVVDFGTATNIEIIDKDGRFIGGIIAPGVETSASALFAHAARLSAIELVDPHTAIGKTTDQAVQAGIVYGEADRVDGLIRRVFDQLGYEAPVIGTGGLAKRMARVSKTITETNPELTLEGLRIIYEASRGRD